MCRWFCLAMSNKVEIIARALFDYDAPSCEACRLAELWNGEPWCNYHRNVFIDQAKVAVTAWESIAEKPYKGHWEYAVLHPKDEVGHATLSPGGRSSRSQMQSLADKHPGSTLLRRRVLDPNEKPWTPVPSTCTVDNTEDHQEEA